MVEHLLQVVTEYEELLWRNDYMPRLSYGCRMEQDDSGLNRYFLMYLFSEQSMAIEFLENVGLLRSKMQYNTCGRDVTWSADLNISEGY